MSIFIDKTGCKYGRLIVLKEGPKASDGKIQWHCKCICGNQILARGNNLSKGHTQSCGCIRSELLNTVKLESKENRPNTAARKYIRDYRRSAHFRKYEWDLTDEQTIFIALGDCHYCGIKPIKPVTIYNTKKRQTIITDLLVNGIDRKDNNLGYTTSNCVPCCTICNYAKRNMTYEEFMSYLQRIAKCWADK